MAWWRVIDSSSWAMVKHEERGKRRKSWMRCSCCSTRWLRKHLFGYQPDLPLGKGPQEAAVEALTLELARRCELEAAQGHCSVWQEQGAEVRGFVSLEFQSPLEEQHLGEELLGQLFWNLSEENARQAAVTLVATRNAIEAEERRTPCHLLRPFMRMLLFDAIVGIHDRHRLNWAVLRGPSGSRLAPMFDTAGCLGSELREPEAVRLLAAKEDQLQVYADRCLSGFGDGERRPQIPQNEVLREISAWPGFHAELTEMCSRFERLLAEQIVEIIDDIPDDWLSRPRKSLACKLLDLRVRLVKEERWK